MNTSAERRRELARRIGRRKIRERQEEIKEKLEVMDLDKANDPWMRSKKLIRLKKKELQEHGEDEEDIEKLINLIKTEHSLRRCLNLLSGNKNDHAEIIKRLQYVLENQHDHETVDEMFCRMFFDQLVFCRFNRPNFFVLFSNLPERIKTQMVEDVSNAFQNGYIPLEMQITQVKEHWTVSTVPREKRRLTDALEYLENKQKRLVPECLRLAADMYNANLFDISSVVEVLNSVIDQMKNGGVDNVVDLAADFIFHTSEKLTTEHPNELEAFLQQLLDRKNSENAKMAERKGIERIFKYTKQWLNGYIDGSGDSKCNDTTDLEDKEATDLEYKDATETESSQVEDIIVALAVEEEKNHIAEEVQNTDDYGSQCNDNVAKETRNPQVEEVVQPVEEVRLTKELQKPVTNVGQCKFNVSTEMRHLQPKEVVEAAFKEVIKPAVQQVVKPAVSEVKRSVTEEVQKPVVHLNGRFYGGNVAIEMGHIQDEEVTKPAAKEVKRSINEEVQKPDATGCYGNVATEKRRLQPKEIVEPAVQQVIKPAAKEVKRSITEELQKLMANVNSRCKSNVATEMKHVKEMAKPFMEESVRPIVREYERPITKQVQKPAININGRCNGNVVTETRVVDKKEVTETKAIDKKEEKKLVNTRTANGEERTDMLVMGMKTKNNIAEYELIMFVKGLLAACHPNLMHIDIVMMKIRQFMPQNAFANDESVLYKIKELPFLKVIQEKFIAIVVPHSGK
ncbi:unnamed protein product [Bursaphelenchus okinawaensis]|uniref:Uncharacterized protein n=1 Tax=Bursaphelenchus okinawaensis TaxID=465554 RepID=A0A811LJ97_9BILA|nr:unnamed protein product [Bursaphelenchus okinawaensis]CAG9124233.1 unnamed protein product [Bursaphelenchus okinawaensis]